MPQVCPDCGEAVKPVGQGTERIEETLARLFPDVPLARIDRDAVRRRGALEAALDRVTSGEVKLLVGTQMLTKGHHFPDVSLVVVLNADHGLFGTDFRASEHLAQTIVQVAGRAGRAERPGEVLIQTEYPEHPLLTQLIAGGYDAFAAAALVEREQAHWPPFARVAVLRAEAPGREAPLAFPIATGYWFSCARSTGGAVSCWGRNNVGQLGDGTTTQRTAPVAVSGLASGGGAITAGGEHACALNSGGGVSCWGRTLYGQIGDGTPTDRWTPTAANGLASGIEALAAGGEHSCARARIGDGILCWGRGNTGQLGDGTLVGKSLATWGTGWPGRLVELASGGSHTCALTSAGGVSGVACWGRNLNGQLGDGTTTNRSTAVSVPGAGTGVRALATGLAHTCALSNSGGVSCWGDNAQGQLGDGTLVQRLLTTASPSLASGVAAITAGENHTCALSVAGAVSCANNSSEDRVGLSISEILLGVNAEYELDVFMG